MAITIPKSIVPNIFTGLDHTSSSNSNFVTDGHFLNRIAQARSTGNIHKNRQATKGAPTIAAGNKKSNESNLQGKLDAVARSGLIPAPWFTRSKSYSDLRKAFSTLISDDDTFFEHSVMRVLPNKGYAFDDPANQYRGESEQQKALRVYLSLLTLRAKHQEGLIHLTDEEMQKTEQNIVDVAAKFSDVVLPSLGAYDDGLFVEQSMPLKAKHFVQIYAGCYSGAVDLANLHDLVLVREHFENAPRYLRMIHHRLITVIKKEQILYPSQYSLRRLAALNREINMINELSTVYEKVEFFMEDLTKINAKSLPDRADFTVSFLRTLRGVGHRENNMLRDSYGSIGVDALGALRYLRLAVCFVRDTKDTLWAESADKLNEITDISKLSEKLLRMRRHGN